VRHILPALGKVGIRRLRYQQIESLYDSLLHPTTEGKALAPKTVYEIHLIIKGALDEALRRGLVARNVAVVARAPKQRSLQRTEGTSLTEDELRQLMRTAAGHRLFPLYWLTAMTGMRRNEVLGLRWPDIDFTKKRLHLNRGLVAVGYEVHQTRGKTRNARRTITLDDTTLTILAGWRAFQAAEFAAVGITNPDQWVFTNGDGDAVHPHAVYEAFRRIVRNAGVPTIRFHDLRHTHGEPAHQRRDPGQGRERTARPRQHLVHHADLPTRPARHASRRRHRNRAARQTRSPAHQRHGGTSGEPSEEDRLNRGNTHTTTKGQVPDLGPSC
jgi:integrase